MNLFNLQTNKRILVIDDNRGIHDDFRKILCRAEVDRNENEAVVAGNEGASDGAKDFEIDSAFQGKEGLELVRKANSEGRPYAMAFVDIRMPPGWDGIDTIRRIWQEYPELEVVICTAHSDYSWDEMIETLGRTDRLLILEKPFDNVEVGQLAYALTAKWALARQAERKMHELEQTVQSRTQELQHEKRSLEETIETLQRTQSQLFQAEKLASIGKLAAGIAHEINNPVGFISSNLNSLGHYIKDIKSLLSAYDGLLQRSESYSGLAGTAAEIGRIRAEKDIDYVLSDINTLIEESIEGTDRVRQIVADLRDFSHVNDPEVVDQDINDLLNKTINVAWNELKYKAEIVREYAAIPAVRCYGGKLAQAFLNMLVNAAHAITNHGKITIRTGTQDDYVWVEIEDSGCGITPENLNRIFDPFFTTKDVGKGTGLGLHLAYTTVQAHGGRINVKSALNVGTTFRVELPIAGPRQVKEDRHECIV
jgi:two-component system, NtrC family, sensor kinase